MKKLFISLVVAFTAVVSASAANNDLFPYPVPPEDMVTLQERCNYLVVEFWKPADLKSALSRQEKLHNCFGDWVSFMPYAHADSVHAAIDRLLDRYKKNGKVMLRLAQMAEEWTFSDSTGTFSEEIYYPFAKAAAQCEKIKNEDRIRFGHHAQIIENSGLGNKVQHLNFTKPDGSQGSIDDLRTQIVILWFNNHNCDACTLGRVRLSADINANALIKAGLLSVAQIEKGEATDAWKIATETYPENWTIGASPDAAEYFDLRGRQTIFILDARHKVLAKSDEIENLLHTLASIRRNAGL